MNCIIQSFLELKSLESKKQRVEVIKRYLRMKYHIEISTEALMKRLEQASHSQNQLASFKS